MIRVDYPYKNRPDRIRHYSDIGMMIRQEQTENLYVEAVDIYPTKYTYTETDIPIEISEELEEQNDEGN